MSKPPNIWWIVTDQQRFDSLGCYGSTAVLTPNLDRLAAGGMRFGKCYCTNPICTPSRASMLTGHHVVRHGVHDLDGTLADEPVLLPEYLRRLGYHTGRVGKLHEQSGRIESERRHPHDGLDVYDFYYGGGAMMDSPLPYEANVHVPLLVRWPGQIRVGTSDQVVQLNDVAAMSLHAAGGDSKVMPDAINPLHGRREVATCVYHNSGLGRGHVSFDPPIRMAVATDGRWKLCRYGDGSELLFDLATDPDERTTVLPGRCWSYASLAEKVALHL